MRKIDKIICWAAFGLLGFIIYEGLGFQNRIPGDPGKEAFALSLFRDLDAGRYDRISDNYLEAGWSESGDDYIISDWLNRNEILYQLNDDFGYKGWRMRLVALEVVDSWPEEVDRLAETHPRMFTALDSLGISEVYIVRVKGSVTGRCSIDNWIKTLPIIEIDGRVKIVSPGLPEDLVLLHPEYFMKDIVF